MAYLAIVVLVTIVLYYALYIPGAVSPMIIAHFGMTFHLRLHHRDLQRGRCVRLGAAGLSDRWGRANLVAYGGRSSRPAGPVRHSERRQQVVVSRSCSRSSASSRASSSSPPRPWCGTSRRSSAGPRRWASGPSGRSSAASWSPSCPPTRSTTWARGRTSSSSAASSGSSSARSRVVGLRELSPQLRDQLMVSHARPGADRGEGARAEGRERRWTSRGGRCCGWTSSGRRSRSRCSC